MFRNRKDRGLTLVELMIALAITVIITGLVVKAFYRFRDGSLLNSATDNVTSMLEEARNATLSSRDDSVYGVHIESTKAVLFKGNSYSANDSNNKVFDFDRRLSVTTTVSGSNIIFSRQTGATSNTGTTTISLAADSTKKRTIFVGSGGTIER